MSKDFLNDKRTDALKELGNIGAAHAATALSQMLGHTIQMTVPQVTFVKKTQIENSEKFKDKTGIAIYTDMYGKIKGKILLFFEYSNAVNLVEILLKREAGSVQKISEIEESALKEVGNILSSAYLNAVSQILDGVLLPSIPSISIDTLSGVLSFFTMEFKGMIQNVLWIETELRSEKSVITGDFFLFPHETSLDVIFNAMKVD